MGKQMLENLIKNVDVYSKDTAALFTPPLKVYDFPSTGTSIHIHGSSDGNFLYGGSITRLGTNEKLRTFNGYEASMIDLNANKWNLPNKMDRYNY